MAEIKRLGHGGRIDRSRSISFSYDGKKLQGFAGDTLASALIANGVKVVGRSFKYHRARGIFSAGVEEPNALVALREGGRHEANSVATTTELYPELAAFSQNCWPSVGFDLMAVNGLFSPFFSAGFYYKTFMGPTKKAWMFYEHFIRRAAGMGVAGTQSDPDLYEKHNAFCDLLVIGAGPSGIAAALAAAKSGVKVVLVEQQAALGGSLLDEVIGSDSDGWLHDRLKELSAFDNVRVMLRTTAFGAYDHGTFGLIERLWDHVAEPPEHQPRQRYWTLRAKKTVLATGMIERPIVFSGNDLPGVMLASAARTYVNRYAVLPGRNVVVFTNNDCGYESAIALADAGAVVYLVDARHEVRKELRDLVSCHSITLKLGAVVSQAKGRQCVKKVLISDLDPVSGQISGRPHSRSCDLLCVSGGWSPTLHLWSQRGAKPKFDNQSNAFVPDAIVDGIECIGACSGIFQRSQAVIHGYQVGERVTAQEESDGSEVGLSPGLGDGLTDTWYHTIKPLNSVPDIGGLAKKAFVDFQHDVTHADIRQAHQEGYTAVEHLKRYTTQGMAGDQGRTSNVNALAIMANCRSESVSNVGTTTFRPPFTPVTIGALAGHEFGEHYEPTRLSPMHDWHVENGAKQIEAGIWQRAWYYPKAGEGVDEAYRREAAHVRSKVGLVDVSTLGKILVEGPDAAEFLERVYTNGWKTLKVNRARYGVMLRDDGIVLDDGTTARLAEDQFFMTTTTANAARVMAHMENLLQTVWPELKVLLTSISDQWAAMALAGPDSRKVLQKAVEDTDVGHEALPPMGVLNASIDGAPVRIHRMSFSGERAYEVFTPAGYGYKVWCALMRAGEAQDICPYGTEGMAALRIEKGHVAGPELDGRTVMNDLGLEGLASKKKCFVGGVLRQRPYLIDENRSVLVGLETLNGTDRIKSGSILFSSGVESIGHGEGHVTSTTYSSVLGKNIALALLSRGKERVGEVIVCSNPIENQKIEVKVTSPHFYDPKGDRMNG